MVLREPFEEGIQILAPACKAKAFYKLCYLSGPVADYFYSLPHPFFIVDALLCYDWGLYTFILAVVLSGVKY